MRIISVRDTRQYDEGPDGRFYPIPGSGIEHECHRCGRNHEIHFTVADGNEQYIVGSSCAHADEIEGGDKAIKSAVAAAKRLARARAEHARLTDQDSRYCAALAEAKRRPFPVYITEQHTTKFDTPYMIFKTVDGRAQVRQQHAGPITAERLDCLQTAWRSKLASELSGISFPPSSSNIDRLAEQIEKLERQLSKLEAERVQS